MPGVIYRYRSAGRMMIMHALCMRPCRAIGIIPYTRGTRLAPCCIVTRTPSNLYRPPKNAATVSGRRCIYSRLTSPSLKSQEVNSSPVHILFYYSTVATTTNSKVWY